MNHITVFTAWGAARGLLPAYPVKMRYLASNELVQPGDLLCISADRSEDFHAWVSIVEGSTLCGMTVEEIKREHEVLIARKHENRLKGEHENVNGPHRG